MEEEPDSNRDGLRVGKGVLIPPDELVWKFTTSGGPGGQHANKASTKVELRFDVESSHAFNDQQRARLISTLGKEVRIVSGEERSQLRNRQAALARLASRISEGLKPPTKRFPTKPTKGSKLRRLDDKRRQSERKGLRSKPPGDD